MRAQTPGGLLDVEFEVFDLPPTFPIVLPVCRVLGIAGIVDRFCPMNHCAHVSHGQVIEFLVLHLLQAPHRLPLYKLEEWASEHNVNQLYDCPSEAFNDDRVGHALEAVAPAIDGIETALVTAALERYHIPVQAVHWDLTHVTFSGAYDGAELIGPGYGDGQVHEKQLHLSLHVDTEHGLPLRHETLPGNAQQGPLAADMLADLQQRLPRSDLLIISDCAGISYDNIVTYQAAGAHFLGPVQLTPAERQWVQELPPEGFVELSYRSPGEPECVYSCHDTTLTLQRQKRDRPLVVRALVIHTTTKQQRDARQRKKQLTKTLARLEQITGYLNKARYAHADYARQQVDKAIPQSLHGIVQAELHGADKQLQLQFWVDEAALAQAARADGRYLLISDQKEPSADDLFRLFKRQAIVEKRFRNFNSNLSVHPLWLKHEDRIIGLLAVFVFALIVYALLNLCSERAKLEGDYYHKLTPEQMLYKFGKARLKQLRIRGQPTQLEFDLSVDQRYILHELGFPDPASYLNHNSPPTTTHTPR